MVKKITIDINERSLETLLALAYPGRIKIPNEKELLEVQMSLVNLMELYFTQKNEILKLPSYNQLEARFSRLSESDYKRFFEKEGFPLRFLEALEIFEDKQLPEPIELKVKDLDLREFVSRKFKAKWVIGIFSRGREKVIYYLWNIKGKPTVGQYEINDNKLKISDLQKKLDFTGRFLVRVQKGIILNVGFYRIDRNGKKFESVRDFKLKEPPKIQPGKIEEDGLGALQRFQISRLRYLKENLLHKKTLGYMEDLGIFDTV